MKYLAINTASSFTAVALLKQSDSFLKLIDEDGWKSNNDEAELLMPAIQTLLQKHKLDYTDLNSILSIKGPGSFTGLRVGVSVANTIAYLTGTPLYSLDAFHLHWLTPPKPTKSALLIYAGAKGLYISLDPQDHHLVPLEQAPQFLKEKNITAIFGDITEQQKQHLNNFTFSPTKSSFGQTLEKLDHTQLKPTKIVKPLYIKRPGITISKKSLFN